MGFISSKCLNVRQNVEGVHFQKQFFNLREVTCLLWDLLENVSMTWTEKQGRRLPFLLPFFSYLPFWIVDTNKNIKFPSQKCVWMFWRDGNFTVSSIFFQFFEYNFLLWRKIQKCCKNIQHIWNFTYFSKILAWNCL